MKKYIFGVLLCLSFSALAVDVCEIGINSRRIEGNPHISKVVSVNCTSYGVYQGFLDYIVLGEGASFHLADYKRVDFKKRLIEDGYRATPETSAYETYIKE